MPSPLLQSLHLPDLHNDYQLVCDLKLANIILGIQSCSVRCKSYTVDGVWVKGKMRTNDSIKANNDEWVKWLKSKQKRNKLKNYKNYEYPPIEPPSSIFHILYITIIILYTPHLLQNFQHHSPHCIGVLPNTNIITIILILFNFT